MVKQRSIDEALRRLTDVYDPLSVYSFEETSDYAFIIIIEGSWQKPHKRSVAGKYALWGLEVPKDILVFTKDEFEQGLRDATSFVHRIKTEGKLLYARA